VIDDRVQRHSQEGSTRIAACRAAFAAANEPVVAGNWPHPTSTVEPTPRG
jgi:hypothetical protein